MVFKKFLKTFLVALCLVCLVGCVNGQYEYEGTLVTYELNGGVFQNCTNPIRQYYQFKEDSGFIKDPVTISGEKLTRANYNFGGWFTDENLTKEFNFDSTRVSKEGITLYAKWNPIVQHVYNVCYLDESGAKVSLGTYNVTSDSNSKFNDTFKHANKRSGYTAIGFCDENGNEWDKNFVHPRPEGESLTIDVYVEYIKGSYSVVRTKEDLIKAVNNNIYLMNDIDMEGATLNFTNYSKQFCGNNYTIKNAVVNTTVSRDDYVEVAGSGFAYYISLFGEVSGAVIENVKFENVEFNTTINFKRGPVYIGALATKLIDSTITNVSISGTCKYTARQTVGFSDEDFIIESEISILEASNSTIENVTVEIVKGE